MAAKKPERNTGADIAAAAKARAEARRRIKGTSNVDEAEVSFVNTAPDSRRRRGKQKVAKVTRTRAAQLNVRIDDELMATLRALAARRKANAVRPYLTRDIVELALVEWIEKADKRLRRDNREAAEALRQLADELASD
jgi:hypothetical protein